MADEREHPGEQLHIILFESDPPPLNGPGWHSRPPVDIAVHGIPEHLKNPKVVRALQLTIDDRDVHAQEPHATLGGQFWTADGPVSVMIREGTSIRRAMRDLLTMVSVLNDDLAAMIGPDSDEQDDDEPDDDAGDVDGDGDGQPRES